MNCPHCNADLTKSESVTRWWSSYGHYQPKSSWDGGFVEENDGNDQNFYDTCIECGLTIKEEEGFKNA